MIDPKRLTKNNDMLYQRLIYTPEGREAREDDIDVYLLTNKKYTTILVYENEGGAR